MSYLFFILTIHSDTKIKKIEDSIKPEKGKLFNESSITFIDKKNNFNIYLGYFKKKEENSDIHTHILLSIDDICFQSKEEFFIQKNKSIFIKYIEFDKTYKWYFIRKNIPKCYKLDNYLSLKIYIENINNLGIMNERKIKFELLDYFNRKYKENNTNSLQFYLLLIKHCYDYNKKGIENIKPNFNFNLEIGNGKLIEDEFGEMVDEFAFEDNLKENDDDLIKLILFYYHRLNKEKFHKFLVNKKIINKIILIIIQNKYFFNNLSKKDILLLIKDLDDIEKISSIINLNDSLIEKINIVIEIFDKIYKLVQESEYSIYLTDLIKLKNNENEIKEIIDKYYSINTIKPSEKLIINLDFLNIINSNLTFQSIKYIKNKINELYDYFRKKNDTKLGELENLNTIVGKKFREIGVSLILRNEMSNLQIIGFIQEDSHIEELGEGNNNLYLKDFYRKKNFNESLQLIDHIKIDLIDDSFISSFKKIKFHSIYGQNENYQNLISKLFERSKNIKEFHKVFKLFHDIKNSVIDNELFPKQSRKDSLETLKKILKKNKNNDFNINEFLVLFLDIIDMAYEFYQEIDRILIALENIYSNNIISNLYIKLLNENNIILNKKYDFVVKICIKYLTNSRDLNTNKYSYIYLLKHMSSNNIKSKVLNQFESKIINMEEIFDYNFSDNLKLLSQIIKNNYFSNRIFSHIPYIKNTQQILNTMINKIENEDIFYEDNHKIMELYNKKKLIERLDIIYLYKNQNVKNIEDKIIEKINLINNFIKYLNDANDYFKTFYPKANNENIKKIDEILEKKNKLYLREYDNKMEELKFLDDYKNDIENLLNKKRSKFYFQLFTDIRDDPQNEKMTEEEKVNQTNDAFDKIKTLFTNFDNIDIPFFSSLVKGLKTKNDLYNEINLLKGLFNIDNNCNIDSIVDNLYLIKQKEENIFKLENLLTLINKLKCNPTKLNQELESNLNHLKQDNLKIQDFIDINRNINELKIPIIEKEKYFNVLNELMEKKEVLDFLLTKKFDDIRLLTEFMDDLDNGIIQMKDINDLEKSVQFIEQLKNKCNFKNDEILIDTFCELIDKEYKDISLNLNNIKGKISTIIEGYTESLNDDERSNKLIKYISTSSSFKIKNQNYQYYDCVCEYDLRNKINIKSFDDIILLKEKAWLRKKQNNDDIFFNTCQTFCINVNKINDIIKIINEINNKGYPEKLDTIVNIKNEKVECKLNNFSGNLDEIIEYLENILSDVEYFRKEYNTKNDLIRLIYGKQISEIYRYLKERRETTNLKYLNKYLTNNKINGEKSLDEYNFDIKKKNKLLEEMYENCILYIEKLYKINKIKISDIYKNSKLKKNYKGIYTFFSSIDSMESNIIQIYNNLTGNFPIIQTILFCSQETTKEEIFSFLNRAILNKGNILFSIIKPEILEIEICKYLLDILNILLLNNKDISSTILFVYFDKTNNLINEIKKKENHKVLVIGKFDKNILKDENEIKIYLSDVSGRGKSTKIYKDFEPFINQNYEYVYFPIGDNITRDEILIRLTELKNKQISLHIDLLETNKLDLIRDFLFSFLIMKYYSKEENIFYYGNEIKIKIEIPNSFDNYFNKFPILDFFEVYRMDINNLEPLIVVNDITSNVQIVANYLNYKKNNLIDSKGLFFHNLHYTEESQEEYNNVETITKEKDEDDAKILSQQECEQLINEEITKFYQNPTYYQKRTFIDVLANQLILFSKDFHIKVENVKWNQMNGIRSEILNSIIGSTQYFLKNAYENILHGQNISYNAMNEKYDENESIQKANEILSQRTIVSFDQIKESFVFINEDKMSFSIITNCKSDSNEYSLYKNFINMGLKSNNELIDYKNLEQDKYIEEIRKIFNIQPTYSDKLIKDEFLKSYIFTADNFLKLILILLRIRAKVPVILMGETGCGKTSLIRIIANMSKLKYMGINFEEINMKVYNIHAGITDSDIIEWITKNNLLETENHGMIESLCPKILVFFDEINTCNSMGLISEILCKHTMQGKKLKFNVIFIAACNPYRIDSSYTEKRQQIGLIKKGTHQNNTLVYRVNPLPFSLINFIFDFGNLTSEDEEKYIKSILSEALKNEENFETNLKLGSDLIKECQNFIRNKNDISSVSLREIRRFVILYNWFKKFLKKNNKLINNKEIDLKQIQEYSLILSTYIVYYIRIYDQDERDKLIKDLNKIIKGNFISYPKYLSKYIINEIELEPGIAKNRALVENIFAIFVCINNLIPIFICGKPGCSKSLSVQLVFKSMRGEDSSKKIFKNCPKIYQNAYQGSLNSTSKGVKSIFDKARKMIKDNDPSKVISLVYFDEMGLAEISKNNPLKVIHSELEYDDNYNKVAFIGISNWVMDASKMNRGIQLSIPEPTQNDLIETAKSIVQSFNEDYSDFFGNLAISYYKYKQFLKKNYPEYSDFHGNRDFYHLIKTVCKKMARYKNKEEYINNERIALESIERNFGGLDFSIREFKKIFLDKDEVSDRYDIKGNLIENLKDNTSRYVLIITKSSISQFLIDIILTELNKKYTFFLGSGFEDDKNKEEYSAKNIHKIQVCMEKGTIAVFKNLESIYPSLYDLFNQNFLIQNNNKYARIAIGSSNNKPYKVDDKFKSIIIVDEKDIKEQKQDPPFLNRFEKYLFSFNVLLTKELANKSEQIVKYLQNLISPSDKRRAIDLEKQLLLCEKEEIQGLIYQLNKIGKNNIELVDEVLKKISNLFSQDIISFATKSNYIQKYPEILEKIKMYYNQNEHSNIFNFLTKMTNNKNIIYTFSDILESIFKNPNEIIKNNIFGDLSKSNVEEDIFVYNITSERQLENKIEKFFKDENKKICIFKLFPIDCIHLNSIKFIIENFQRNYKKENKKCFIFIIYLKRYIYSLEDDNNDLDEYKIENQNLISLISDFSQIFIDNLHGPNISIFELLNLNNKELFKRKDMINIEEQMKIIIYEIFATIDYQFKNLDGDNLKQNYIETISGKLLENKSMCNRLIELAIKLLEEDDDIVKDIFYENNLFEKFDIDFISVVSKFMKEKFKDKLSKIIVNCERNSILSNLILHNNPEVNSNLKMKLFDYYVPKMNLNKNVSKENLGNKVELSLGLNIHWSIDIYKSLINKCNGNKLIEDFKTNETDLRGEIEEEELNEEINSYKSKKNNYYKMFYNFLEQILDEIIKEDKENLIDLITNDFYTIIFYVNEKQVLQKNNINNNLVEQDENNENTKINQNKNIIDFVRYIAELQLEIDSKESIFNDIDKKLIYILLWFQCNLVFIQNIIKIYKILCNYIPNLLEKIKDIIKNEKVKFEISKRNPEYKRYTNYLFTILIESLIFSIFYHFDFNTLTKDNQNEFLKNLNEIIALIDQTKTQLNMYLNEFSNLISLVEVSDALISIKKFDIKKIDNYKQIINFQNENIKNENINKAINSLQEEYDFLYKNLNENQNFPEIVISILSQKVMQVSNDEYRNKILELILKENKLIINSKLILWILFTRYKLDIKCPNDNEEEDEEEDEEELVNKFMSFTEVQNMNLDLLNSQNNIILDEILIYLFEIKINSFLNNDHLTIDKLIDGIIIEYLKKCIDVLNGKIKPRLKNLAILYSISFIKSYFYLLVNKMYKIAKSDENQININKINTLLKNDHNNIIYVIKLYILKCFYSKMQNFNEFINFEWDKNQLSWAKNYKYDDKNDLSKLQFLYINVGLDMEKLKEYNFNFSHDKNICSFKPVNKEFYKKLINEDFMTFIDVSINIMLSDFVDSKYSYYFIYDYFCDLIKEILPYDNISLIFKLFFDNNIFGKLMKNKIKDLKAEQIEILLYGYKLAILCSLGNENSLYNNLLSEKFNNIINTIFIPGSEPYQSIKKNSYERAIEHFSVVQTASPGFYICNCNQFYLIGNCSQPNEVIKCRNCPKQIGGKSHILVDGSRRIYRNENEKNSYPKIPGITLEQFKNEIREEEEKDEKSGIVQTNLTDFSINNKKVRNLKPISYRILNFIFYSILYYNNILGYIKDNEIKNYYISGKNIIDLLDIIWNCLKDLLNSESINNIKIFMNSLFPKINDIIKNQEITNTKEKRLNFEEKFDNIITQCINEYQNYFEKYQKINNYISQIKLTSLKTIITEQDFPELPEDKFPFFKYFTVPAFPKKDDLNIENDSIAREKYPVIFYYQTHEEIEIDKNIVDLNSLEKELLSKYSFNITREDARKLIIKDEIVSKNDNTSELYLKFKEAYNKYNTYNRRMGCHDLKTNHILKDSDNLSYILNDNGVQKEGMHLAAIYQYFIDFQNQILDNILQNKLLYKNLGYFSESINNEIYIQDANKNEIVTFKIRSALFKSYQEIISIYSNRNIFDQNGINYFNYKNIEYNFDKIEIEVGKIVLSNKRKFKEDQKYITYIFEEYRNKSDVFSLFLQIYPQTQLIEETKEKIINFILEDIKDYRDLLSSMNKLIFYLHNKSFKINESIYDNIIPKLPNHIQLSTSCINLFKNLSNIKINQLIEVYEYIELQCFEEFKNNLNKRYKEQINKDDCNKYIEFLKNIEKKSKLTKLILGKALRKFICRYICGKRDDEAFHKDTTIFEILKERNDIWDKEFLDSKNYEEIMEELQDNIKLTQNYVLDFYDILECDEKLKITKINLPKNQGIQKRKNKKKNKRKSSDDFLQVF